VRLVSWRGLRKNFGVAFFFEESLDTWRTAPFSPVDGTSGLPKYSHEQWLEGAVQPLLSNPSVPNLPAPSVAWSDVARLCRRMCVLRERGLNQEAEALRTGSLPELLSAARTSADTDATMADHLEKILSQESERVANAAVLAELLVPLLSEQLKTSPALQRAMPAANVPAPPPPAKPPARRAASIADFIDEMIAQENPPERPQPQRRAS
jgi:hypothetical protein